MEFREIKISTTTEGIDIVTGALAIAGLSNFVIEDASDFEDFLASNTPRWDYVDEDLMEAMATMECAVKLYLANNAQGAEQLEEVKRVLAEIKERDEEGLFGSLELEVGTVREEDWENNWKQYFKPFTVGDKFIIKPSWEELEDTQGRTVLEIDPASSFGTGGHATTQLCIEALEELVTGDCRFLDLGCGSGILTMAAGLLGARDLTAVDIDENAVRIANENISRVNLSAKTYVGDVTSDTDLIETIGEGYDVVAANIVADVLLAIMPFMHKVLKPGCRAVLSGIILERLDEITTGAVAQGFKVVKIRDKDDWASVIVEK